eukprot:182884-Ditylum_brightwellii.AAC.1
MAKRNDPRWTMPAKAEMLMMSSYRPELDITSVLSLFDIAYYQSRIGMLRWMVELCRVDICLEVSLMPSHLAMPREGHMAERDWTSREIGHVQGKEEVPSSMHESRSTGFAMRAKVDAGHTGGTFTRQYRTIFIIYLSSAQNYWMSKKQTSIEASSFGSEFIATKQWCEQIYGL